ncbi:MAG TPA: class I SAM-dependent methyltransferase [Gaiellaceae bacterium]|nr:class I SAM-dependent methyltransferase [Gaiellaceae bacterium]
MQFHDAPSRYLDLMRKHVPLYDRVQEEVVRASDDLQVSRLLDLGIGTGETTRRCLVAHPKATAIGLDSRPKMLDAASSVLGERAELRLGRLEDPLPEGSFELVVSAFAVHHLDGVGKASLFRRIADVLSPGGRFVMADVVIPDTPVPEPTPLSPGEDLPDRTDDLVEWMSRAGLKPEVRWTSGDLAVIAAAAPD